MSSAVIDTYVIPLIKILFVLNATLIGVTYMVLLERKVIAWVQVRLGPMRVGPYGILQPIADAIKLILKEDITPTRADKWVFTAAPIIVMVPALITFAVIPFGSTVHLFGRDVPLYITDVNVGLLYIVSVASIGVYGIILGGWASNSKFPLLASLRASAQLISYEVAVTMTLVSLIMTAGSLSMVRIVEAQNEANLWFIFVQPVAFVLFFIGGLAETNRAPFDMAEAEQELTGGFHTEVQRHAVRAVLPRRIRQHDRRLLGRDDAVPGRISGAVSEHRCAQLPRLRAGVDVVPVEDVPLPVRLPVGARDAAALPLRPADAAGVEGAHPGSHRQRDCDGNRQGVALELWAKR